MSAKDKTLLPVMIIELANTHAGCEQFKALINKIRLFEYPNKAIKFQIFHPDMIATDLHGTPCIRVVFEKATWRKVDLAASVCDVWIDV